MERRWADLADANSRQPEARAGNVLVTRAQQGARELSQIMSRTADALEKSAHLADQHAQRREQAEQGDDAAEERRVADQTREAARQARSNAEQWLKISEKPIR